MTKKKLLPEFCSSEQIIRFTKKEPFNDNGVFRQNLLRCNPSGSNFLSVFRSINTNDKCIVDLGTRNLKPSDENFPVSVIYASVKEIREIKKHTFKVEADGKGHRRHANIIFPNLDKSKFINARVELGKIFKLLKTKDGEKFNTMFTDLKKKNNF